LQKGGVGFYPTSGSPFVHLDTGSVRHWPSIAAADMPRLMSEGHNLHAAAEAADTGANRQPVVAKVSGGRTAPVRTAAAPPEPPRQAPVVNVAVEVERPGSAPTPIASIGKPKAQVAPAPFELASVESRPVELRPSQVAGLPGKPAPSANDVINQRLD